MQPLVITLAVDAATQRRFDAERRQWFPAGRTQVGAHVTLFHAVPGELRPQVETELHEVAGPAFEVTVARVMSLGRGVAYELTSEELISRHRLLQRAWRPHLTAQDQQRFRPHVTVQNKVSPARARAALDEIRAGFTPFDLRAEGFVLWRYDDGPWTELNRVPFG